MGTWGTGPFASDTAQDYLDGLVALSGVERSQAVRLLLAAVVAEPSQIAEEVMPEEVIAAAALVAESLLGDGAPPWGKDDLAHSARLEEPLAPRDIGNAVRALGIVADPRGWYMRSWSSEVEMLEAQRALEQIRSVLSGRHGTVVG